MNTKPDLAEFFLVALPGLEDLVASELAEWFPHLEPKIEFGGITVFATLSAGLSMNMVLKTPTRILLRIETFRCRDFPKLYNKVKKIEWSKWLQPDCQFDVQATARLSRINMKKRIESTCLDALPKGDGPKIQLFVRIHKDDCTLSLDTSGERLHKRGGQNKHIGKAPLRESIAAALIQAVSKYSEAQSPIEIIDPMMGSGTFLSEAQLRYEIIESRHFNFDCFLESDIKAPKPPNSVLETAMLIGFEKDRKTFEAAKANLKSVDIINEDIFEANVLGPTENERWLFCNPPYGERLKTDTPLRELYEKLFQTVSDILNPKLSCFILPTKVVKGKFNLPRDWKVKEKRPFLNGGIPVTAFIFQAEGSPKGL